MPEGQHDPPPAGNRTKYWIIAAVMLVVLLLLAFPIRKYFYVQPPTPSTPVIADIDPLCQFVSGKWQLRCVVALAAEGVLGPGHYVNYDLAATSQTKVPFPNGSLFAAPCLVPGAEATSLMSDLQKQETTNDVNFDRVTYKLDRHFQAGAELPVPKLDNLVLKAGPKLSEIQNITINAPHAWIIIVDEAQFIDLVSHAGIKQSCIDNVIARKYNVISKAAIAKDFDITVTDTSGHSIALSAAATNGQVTVDAGGDAGSTVDQTISKASSSPLVVAVDFFNPQLFIENRSKLTAPFFSSAGQTEARVVALGDQGVAWQREHSGPVGAALEFHEQGQTSGGACGGGDTFSAQFRTSVTSKPATTAAEQTEQPFEFATDGLLKGALMRHGPFCTATNEARVQADVSFRTQVETTVRSDNASTLAVDLPGGLLNPTVQVFDWQGKELTPKSRSPEGAIEFAISGPGVYRAIISGVRQLSSNGAASTPINDRSRFTVSVR